MGILLYPVATVNNIYRTIIREGKMTNSELTLDKYVEEPICLALNDGMLEVGGVTVADEVTEYDAVTDVDKSVHGVVLRRDKSIVYFCVKRGVPTCKVIATNAKAVEGLAVTECKGVLHILIYTGGEQARAFHFYTRDGKWQKSAEKRFDGGWAYKGCCSMGEDLLLMVKNGVNWAFWADDGVKWRKMELDSELVADDAELEEAHGVIGINYIADGKVRTMPLKLFECQEYDGEDIMANGNTLNSKYIMQLNKVEEMLGELKARVEEISQKAEALDKIIKQMNKIKEMTGQHELQINQLSIRLQETNNRLTGVMRGIKG